MESGQEERKVCSGRGGEKDKTYCRWVNVGRLEEGRDGDAEQVRGKKNTNVIL